MSNANLSCHHNKTSVPRIVNEINSHRSELDEISNMPYRSSGATLANQTIQNDHKYLRPYHWVLPSLQKAPMLLFYHSMRQVVEALGYSVVETNASFMNSTQQNSMDSLWQGPFALLSIVELLDPFDPFSLNILCLKFSF